ncbi:MAG TPA: formate dehydrogenase accessory sulfurtransferase FdhD [Mycobacteriales bacterium]|nr:formate dehydrogenase accessory sulfurtransferase FdhD [Mycobacteriales bacterium]
MGRVTVRRPVLRLDTSPDAPHPRVHRPDSLAAEEPLEIRIGGVPLAITMRTPGQDMDLAAGFLVSEGVVSVCDELAVMRFCAGADVDGRNSYNVLECVLADGVPAPDPSVARAFYTTSSCGLCGKASIDAVRTRSRHPVGPGPELAPALLAALPDRLRAAQRVFDATGGLHAAGLFDAAGELLVMREDVGRHNAVDKVIGWALRENRLPLSDCVLLVSGRASFELVQKASMAGIPVLAAVSAPSSLAAELADEAGITLVGFLRGTTMNVYAHPARLGG